MKSLKNQLVAIITSTALVIGGGLVAWGRLQQVVSTVEGKADVEAVEAAMQAHKESMAVAIQANKEAMTRELDHIQQQLSAINQRLDGIIVRQAIIQPADNP